MTMVDFAIETEDLTGYYGTKRVVDSLTLAVPRGSVFALLGRSGAGKTTTLRMLLGFHQPTRGNSRVLGWDSTGLMPAVRGRIGYMSESHPLHDWMTVEEEGRFASSFYPQWSQEQFDAIVGQFDIARDARSGTLSRGQRAGVALALALAPQPELLILDDPAIGLDPVARRLLIDALLEVTREWERTVLLSSHLLDDVERVADHAAILSHGTLQAAGSLEDLTAAMRQYRVTFAPGAVPATLPEIRGLLTTKRVDDTLMLTVVHPGDDTDAVLSMLGPTDVRERAVSFSDAVLAYLSSGSADPSLRS